MLKDHTYKLKYHLDTESGKFSDEDTDVADAVLTLACAKDDEGRLYVRYTSLDGNTGRKMSAEELFRVWLSLGKEISVERDLDQQKKNLAKLPHKWYFEFPQNSASKKRH